MNNYWTLPKTLNIGGKDYSIRYQFGAILDILAAYSDEDLDSDDKTEAMLTIFYPDFPDMPDENIPEAVEKACEFIDCGQADEGKPKPRLVDWEKDASIIIPAINNVAGMEIRSNPDLHWWTFFGYFMSIGDSLFSSVLHIRRKKKNGKKLEKWEQEFYQENQHLIDMRTHETEEIKAEKANILKYL